LDLSPGEPAARFADKRPSAKVGFDASLSFKKKELWMALDVEPIKDSK